MEHLVRFLTAEGREGSHSATSLEEAVAFVERLRNSEGATQVKLYQLTEVPIEFKTYYRVEVGGGAATPQPAAASQPPPAAAPASAEAQAQGADLESAAANGRRLFSRS